MTTQQTDEGPSRRKTRSTASTPQTISRRAGKRYIVIGKNDANRPFGYLRFDRLSRAGEDLPLKVCYEENPTRMRHEI